MNPIFFNGVGLDETSEPHGDWDWEHPEMMPKGWYHSDEAWAHCYGPYLTEEAAREALDRYAENL